MKWNKIRLNKITDILYQTIILYRKIDKMQKLKARVYNPGELKSTHKEANVSIGLVRATNNPSHAPFVSTAQTPHQCWLGSDFFHYPEPILSQPFCTGFLFLAFLAGWAVTSNAGCIFSAIVTKWTSSPATPYFCRGVCWIFPASVKRNVCTCGGGRDRGGRRQNETWRHLTNPCYLGWKARIGQLFLSPAAATEVCLFSFLSLNTKCIDCSQDSRTISPSITNCVSEQHYRP